MTRASLLALCVIGVIYGPAVLGQSALTVDVSQIGPKVGATAPVFSGTDQHGATQSLKSAAGPKGTMLVFFRSADW